MTTIKTKEIINDLLGYERLKIIQRPDMFNFSLDSTLLADFVELTTKTRRLIDFGTGFAPIPLFLSLKTKHQILGVEIQEAVADIARRNVELNNLSHQIEILHADINDLPKMYPPTSFDLITCNPPFFKYTPSSNINESTYKTIARHEITVNLSDIIRVAKVLLNNKGRLYLVHRVERLSEIVEQLEAKQFRIKRMRFVHPHVDRPANIVLIEAMNNGARGLKVMPPLVVHENGEYTQAIKAIFKYGSD